MRIKQPCLNRVHLAVKICANTHCIFLKLLRYSTFAAIGDFDLVAFGFQLLGQVGTDAPGAADTTDGIDKQYLHMSPHLFNRLAVGIHALVCCEIIPPEFRIPARLPTVLRL